MLSTLLITLLFGSLIPSWAADVPMYQSIVHYTDDVPEPLFYKIMG